MVLYKNFYQRGWPNRMAKNSRKGERIMPCKIVDLSARSKIINAEPFHLHFWEVTPKEFHEYLKNSRKFLQNIGVQIPADCRIGTLIENHD